jgi:hypothetical protein
MRNTGSSLVFVFEAFISLAAAEGDSFDAFSFGWEHPEPSRFSLIAHIENIKLILSFSGLARGGKSN